LVGPGLAVFPGHAKEGDCTQDRQAATRDERNTLGGALGHAVVLENGHAAEVHAGELIPEQAFLIAAERVDGVDDHAVAAVQAGDTLDIGVVFDVREF